MIIPKPKDRELDQIEVFSRCLDFLKSINICALATGLDAKPRVRAMEYAVDDAGIIYMLTEGGRKLRDILLNPNVSMAVWQEDDSPSGLWGLTITARAEVVDPGARKRFEDYYIKYRRHINRDAPHIDALPGTVKLIRVVPDMMELFDQSLADEDFSPKQIWRR